MKRSLILFGTLVASSLSCLLGSLEIKETNSIEETPCHTLDFANSKFSKNVSSYSNSWSATSNEDNLTYTIVNANNNNGSWKYIKFGSKNDALTGSITSPAFEEAISRIQITIDAVTASNVNSISLFTSADDFSKQFGVFEAKKGQQTISLSQPLENLSYKIEFDCKKSSNGVLQLSKVDFYEEVISKSITKIEILGEPKKTSYIECESFDPTGLTVTATYDDESTADITSKVTWSPSPLSVGDTSVTATYVEGGKTFTATYEGITVNKKEIEIIDVSGKLNKTQYFVGETFDPSGLTVTGMDNIGNEFDLTDKVTWNLSTFDKEATYSSVTATYISEDGLTITDDAKVDIEVKEKVLEGILVDTSNMKLDYTSFDTELDTTGLVVEACYPFDTYEDVTDKVTLSKPDFTRFGKQTITVTFEGETDAFDINVTKYPETSYAYIDSSINEGYYKVTETLKDWSGTYLITYCPDDANVKVFNGLDKANGYTDAKVSSGFITPNESLVSVDIEKYDSGYAIKINNGDNEGKYISGKSGANDLAFNKAASSCSIDFVGDGDITIISNGSYFRYNKDSGQNRFRFFRSSSYTLQAQIALFKYKTNKSTSLASNELLDAAYASLEELEKCNPNGVNSTYDWTVIESNFANITNEEKANLKTALSDGNGNVIERFLEKYDYLVGIKNQNDFLNREPSKQSNLNSSSPLPSKASTTVTYACVFGISAITIASFLLLNRKRRHN